MSSGIQVHMDPLLAVVTISAPQRMNAMSRQMWIDLAATFRALNSEEHLRCVLVKGEGPHFCSGGDISEYAEFRFEEDSLRAFHEQDVWGGLQSMLDCDLPIVAQISGNCMGAGVEIASCCDIRLADLNSRFGAPIGKLGFPMAPREMALVLREAGSASLREMLLSAALIGAGVMRERGFLHGVYRAEELQAEVDAVIHRVVRLAPQAARANKRTLRAMHPLPCDAEAITSAADGMAALVQSAYAYADCAEHREGIAAFMEKRRPCFADPPPRFSNSH